MKNHLNLFVFLILFIIPIAFSLRTQNHLALPPCRQTQYTYSTLALTWLGEYCSQNSCSRNWKEVWDDRSFVIHGYWPASTDLAFLSCQNDNKGSDKYCFTDYKFNLSKLNNLKTDLNRVWPQIGSIKNFWEYQWSKHGTCYLKLTEKSFNSAKLKQDDIFLKYFKGVIGKFDAIPALIGISDFKFNSKSDFSKQLGLKESQFIAICGNDDQLDEIRICYNLAQPEKQKIISCPGSKPKQCSYPVYLVKQQEVDD